MSDERERLRDLELVLSWVVAQLVVAGHRPLPPNVAAALRRLSARWTGG